MQVQIFETPEALAEYSAEQMLKAVREKPDALCCFAAGFTQNETYARFAQKIKETKTPIGGLRLIGLDEWGGLNGADTGSCRAYINEHITLPLGLSPDQILLFFDGRRDLDDQCARADALLDAQGPIDLLILGMGMNGHVGFNEPGDGPQLRAHHHVLSDTSVKVGQKYFERPMALSTGVTLGLADLLKARTILLQAAGAHKRPVVESLLAQKMDAQLPASYLWNTHAVLCVDRAACGGTMP